MSNLSSTSCDNKSRARKVFYLGYNAGSLVRWGNIWLKWLNSQIDVKSQDITQSTFNFNHSPKHFSTITRLCLISSQLPKTLNYSLYTFFFLFCHALLFSFFSFSKYNQFPLYKLNTTNFFQQLNSPNYSFHNSIIPESRIPNPRD